MPWRATTFELSAWVIAGTDGEVRVDARTGAVAR
jgi:hypothetical protein